MTGVLSSTFAGIASSGSPLRARAALPAIRRSGVLRSFQRRSLASKTLHFYSDNTAAMRGAALAQEVAGELEDAGASEPVLTTIVSAWRAESPAYLKQLRSRQLGAPDCLHGVQWRIHVPMVRARPARELDRAVMRSLGSVQAMRSPDHPAPYHRRAAGC